MTKALLCDELRNKSVVVRESFPSDPIPRMTQLDIKEPLFPLCFPIVFDMRLCRRLGTARRARGPVRPHWICWVAGFARFTCFDNVLNGFWLIMAGISPPLIPSLT